MSDPTENTARRWLQRFIELHEDVDTAGDPLQPALDAARAALAGGPVEDDPYRIAAMAAQARPDDPRVAALAEEWHATLLRAQDDHGADAGPIAG